MFFLEQIQIPSLTVSILASISRLTLVFQKMSAHVPTTPAPQADNEDTDSAFGDGESHSTRTCSVSLETKQYVEECGRYYHTPWIPGLYLLPNDEREQDRLRFQHGILLNTDGLYKATLPKDIYKVLDVGTGTGEWLEAFIEKHPSAIITALDISPNVMPNNTYPNCFFFL
jgi:hypothetical protein